MIRRRTCTLRHGIQKYFLGGGAKLYLSGLSSVCSGYSKVQSSFTHNLRLDATHFFQLFCNCEIKGISLCAVVNMDLELCFIRN